MEESNNKEITKKKSRGKRFKEKPDKKQEKVKDKEEVKNKENVEEQERIEKKEKSESNTKKNNTKKIILCVLVVIILICAGIGTYIMVRPKFKNAQIELGSKEINIDMFLVNSMYKKNSKIVTDITQIDLNKVGKTQITLSYNGKEQTVILSVVDTIPPKVTFQDLKKYTDYEINAEDFVLEKTDLSEMTVSILEAPEDISNYDDYKVKISVKDSFGNETIGECILTIAWLKPEITIELGTELKREDLILNATEDGDKISKSELEKVDILTVGEYEIKAEYEGKEYTSKITVQDTTAPELELKDITIYDDEKISDYKKFIKKVSDLSGEPTTTLKTEIDYNNVGTQDIVIEAVDINGNKVEKTATLTIKKDTDGPVISGLTEMSVEKNSSIDYYSGVKAKDAKDGECEITVNSSSVNIGIPGTYYATYTSKDKKGNTTTKKRKIVVKHNQEDTNAKLDEFYNSYCAGKDPVSIAGAVREQIGYYSNWGGDDPVWYGLTEGKGNCYVHATILQQVLNKAGYSNKIIYLTDKSHYWNIVNVGGVWYHLDGTPSVNHTLGLLTNEQKLADKGLHGKTWDVTLWPEIM